MATISVSGKHVVFTSCNQIAAFEIRGDLCVRHSVFQQKQETSGSVKGQEEGSDKILAVAFSASGKYFGACDDCKSLTIWNADASWELHSTRILPRRATALVFSSSEKDVLVADKSGDVHRFAVNTEAPSCDTLVMGHLSMLLDLKLLAKGEFLITCDRDEKIRVSQYPNAYNIQEFCLGHTDFVSRLAYFEDEELLISGSGDGTLKLWDYRAGVLLDDTDCVALLDSLHPVPVDVPGSASVEVKGQPRSVEVKGQAAEEDKRPRCHSITNATVCRGADVRCMVCCPRLKTIAVSFDRQSVVLLFKLIGNSRASKLSFLQRLQLPGAVWDMAFDCDGRLVVLQAKQAQAAAVFTFNSDEQHPQLRPVSDLDVSACGILAVLNIINEDLEFFRPCLEMESVFPNLHKAHIDNMHDYVEKKQARIEKMSLADSSVKKMKLSAT